MTCQRSLHIDQQLIVTFFDKFLEAIRKPLAFLSVTLEDKESSRGIDKHYHNKVGRMMEEGGKKPYSAP